MEVDLDNRSYLFCDEGTMLPCLYVQLKAFAEFRMLYFALATKYVLEDHI
jgi:hypothetical protein